MFFLASIGIHHGELKLLGEWRAFTVSLDHFGGNVDQTVAPRIEGEYAENDTGVGGSGFGSGSGLLGV